MTARWASLRPLAGDPRTIERLVREWLGEDDPEPLSVRTSGSTGRPKDVLLSASAVRASAAASLARIGGPGQWLLALPAHYVAGLQVITRSLLAGTSPVMLDEHPDLVTATSRLTGARRYAALVPTQLHRALATPSDTEALTAYDVVLVGGAAAPPRLVDTARAAGVRVVTTYGLSETCGGCVYDGLPLDGVGVALGPAGEIRIAGPVLFDGYDGPPPQADRTRQVLRNGWFHTSDLGRLDDDGRLVVVGRSDDVVVSGGVNVSLSTVERRLLTMPGVDHAVVTARPDPEWGAEVVAVVEAGRDGQPRPDVDAVRDFVAAVHPRSWAPRRLIVVDALPMLTTGEVDRRQVAVLVAERVQA